MELPLFPMKLTSLLLAVGALLLSACSMPSSVPTSREPTPMGTVYAESDVDTRPMPIRTLRPIYPAVERDAGISGEARVRVIVDAEGRVRAVEGVQSSTPGFGLSAAESVAKWVFKPARKNGEAVACRTEIPVRFDRM